MINIQKIKQRPTVYLGWLTKRVIMAIFDVIAVNLAYWLALIFRFYVNLKFMPSVLDYFPAFWRFAPWYSLICVIVFAGFRLYNSMWKYAGPNDLPRLVLANVTTSALHVVGTLLFIKRMPITYYVFGAAIQLVFITVSRYAYRIYLALRARNAHKSTRINTMIIGLGETGNIVRRKLEDDISNVAHLVCLFTPGEFRSKIINGIPVVTGMEKLKDYLHTYKVECVILADSLMPAEERKQIKAVCEEEQIEIQDFSGYFQYEGNGISFKRQLEYASGPVEITIDGATEQYESGEAALMSLQGNYQVKEITAKENTLAIELIPQKVVLNDITEDWAKEYEKNVGEEISFF